MFHCFLYFTLYRLFILCQIWTLFFKMSRLQNFNVTINFSRSYLRYKRYKDDVYDRLWYTYSALPNSVPINTSSVIDIQNNNDSYQIPSEVLRTAVQPSSAYHSLSYSDLNLTVKIYVCFHFAEIEKLTQEMVCTFI